MKRIAVILLAGFVAVVALAQGTKQLVDTPDHNLKGKPYGAVHALLIGINTYPNLPARKQLSYAANDATALRRVLSDLYGFADVTVLTDRQATLSAIRNALSSLTDNTRVKADDLVLVYFSGHGQTVPTAAGGAMGFLIPSDAKVDLANPTNQAPYLATCLPMKQVWDYLDASPAKHAAVIADACFSGLMTQSRGLGLSHDTLAVLLARRARQVVTAGGSGQETIEKDDIGHGVFTAKLLDELKARAADQGKAFTLSNLFASIQEQVTNATKGKQTPKMGNFDSDGEVVFIPSGVADSPKVDPPKIDPKKDPPVVDPPKAKDSGHEPPVDAPNGNPAGLNRKQGEYYQRLHDLLADSENRFANLPRKSNRTQTKPEGTVDVQVYELKKPLPGFEFGGVTDPSNADAFLYFDGTPYGAPAFYEDYKAAIRAVLPGGREQHFSDTNWRISAPHYQISLRLDKDNEKRRGGMVFERVTLTILRV